MDVEQQLTWEKRRAPAAAACATISALLSLAAFIYFGVAVEGEISNDSQTVLAYDEQSNLFITTSILRAAALVLLIPALMYLFKAAKARRPETPAVGLTLAVIGPALLAAGGLVSAIDRVNAADGEGKLSEKAAEELLRDLPGWVTGFAFGGSLAFAIALIIIALSAMRAGLLSRFMGILGIGLGVLTGLSALGGGVAAPLLIFYFVALALLFLGKWPGGRGPAWDSGEAIPWPTQVDRIKAMEEQKAAEGGDRPPEIESGDPDTPQTASRTKRKRKRR